MVIPVTGELVFSILPPRDPESHKGTYGRVLQVCGCSCYRGAAALSVLGSLRAGAGIVTLAAEECVVQSIASRVLEATFVLLPDDDALCSMAHTVTACLGGCGREPDAKTARDMELMLRSAKGTVVLDAGGLASLADTPEVIRQAAGRLVITPHPGEMARLAHKTVPEVLADAAGTAGTMAEKLGAVVVLKGHRTLICTPDGTLYQNTTGNAGLARGGSGDILAGMIAGFAAQGYSPLDSALCGVYLHGLAADHCAQRLSQQGMLPEDILDDLCSVYLANNR